jgi:hypothetical protein
MTRSLRYRSRNSVADALLIELYAKEIRVADLGLEPHTFVTSNSEDFSLPNGDRRKPHPDLADLFAGNGTSYALGVDGLSSILLDHFGQELEELFEETDFQEEPRRLAEISDAEQEMFDRVGTTAHSSTSTGCATTVTRTKRIATSKLPALAASESRLSTQSPASWVHTPTSS